MQLTLSEHDTTLTPGTFAAAAARCQLREGNGTAALCISLSSRHDRGVLRRTTWLTTIPSSRRNCVMTWTLT